MQRKSDSTEREKVLTETDSIEMDLIETVSFLGRSLKLEIQSHAWKNRAVASGDTLYLFLRADARTEEKEKLIQTWKKESLRKEVARRLPVWEKKTGLYCSCWQIRDMKTRWGTCNVRDKRIWIAQALGAYPEECLEYVIVHELCHLLEPSHNAVFHQYMTRFLPDWKERKDLLNALSKASQPR